MLGRVLSFGTARVLLMVAGLLLAAGGLDAARLVSAIPRTDPTIVAFGTSDGPMVTAGVLALLAVAAWRGATRRVPSRGPWLAGIPGGAVRLGAPVAGTLVALAAAAILLVGSAALRIADAEDGRRMAAGLGTVAAGAGVVAAALAIHVAGLVRTAAQGAAGAPWLIVEPARPRFARLGPVATTAGRARRAVPVAVAVAALAYGWTAQSTAASPGTVACPDEGDGTCRTEVVPLDHGAPDPRRTLSIVYRVVAATGTRTGTLVVMTGGPGVRGLAEADLRLDDIDPSIRRHFDVVFFDQRGIGASDGLACPTAVGSARYDSSREEDQAFVRQCLDELGADAARLPYLSSRQAAEDVEDLRLALGEDRIWVYGESYGTRLAQDYAAAHPDHVAGLVLDGAIDTTESGVAFWRESAAGFASTLGLTLDACDGDDLCRADVGPDPRAALRNVSSSLALFSRDVRMPDGWERETERFDRAALVAAIAPAMYTEDGRVLVLRALAAAGHGDLVPFVRLALAGNEAPPTGPELAEWTILGFYAVECADQDYAADPEASAAIEAAAATGNRLDVGFGRIVLQERPCLFWPRPVTRGLPPNRDASAVPTLILASTGDPVTPLANAQRIAARLPSADLVVTSGGPHVTFRRDLDCPTSVVRAFLVDGHAPSGRRIDCAGDVLGAYTPVLKVSVANYASRADALDAVADDIDLLPEVLTWDRRDRLTVACPRSGTFVLDHGVIGETATFDHCRFLADLELDGPATRPPFGGAFVLDTVAR